MPGRYVAGGHLSNAALCRSGRRSARRHRENGTGGTISRDTAYLDAVGRFLAGSVPATSTR
jgi:hypothetical protein